jgi:hypothetical protein
MTAIALPVETRAIDALLEAVAEYGRAGSLNIIDITDYPADDQANLLVSLALWKALGDQAVRITHASANPLDTRQGSFRTAMCILGAESLRDARNVAFLNVAPIPSSRSSVSSCNGGHRYMVLLLTNGRLVFAPAAGESLAYLTEHARYGFVLDQAQIFREDPDLSRIFSCPNVVQFRSRYLFPAAFARLMSGDTSIVAGIMDGEALRALYPRRFYTAHRPSEPAVDQDNFGNLRFAFSAEDLIADGIAEGDVVYVLRNGIPVGRALFGTPRPELSEEEVTQYLRLRPGSNALCPDEKQVIHYLDLFEVGGDAAALVLAAKRQNGIFPVIREAFQVARRARNAAGIGTGIRALVTTLREGFAEHRQYGVRKHERPGPQITIAPIR